MLGKIQNELTENLKYKIAKLDSFAVRHVWT